MSTTRRKPRTQLPDIPERDASPGPGPRLHGDAPGRNPGLPFEADEILTQVPADKADDPAVAAARAALDNARQAEDLGDLGELQARVAADPADHAARLELAVGLNARGEREAAVDALIEIVRRDRAWNDEAARKQLLQFFEAWGPTDEMTLYGRRQLSSILFS